MRKMKMADGSRQMADGYSFALRFSFLNFIFAFFVLNYALAQSPSIINKSDKTETVDGKKYYIHSVEKGQTLYSISKTYSVTVDIIISNNQTASQGLKQGDKLKIPFNGSADASKKEIEKQNKAQAKQDKKKKGKPSGADSTKKEVTLSTVQDSIITPIIKPIGDIHVALFLPLDLSMIERLNVGKIAQGDEKIPEDTRIGIEFYEGVKLAFDSLRKQGFAGFLHIYDSQLDSASFAKLMTKPELKEMDLIIGPLYGKKFETVLKFAKANSINIVSPTLLGNNMLLGSPNVSKLTPSFVTQTEEIAKYTVEKFAGQNIIVFNSTNAKDKSYLNTFKRTANSLLSQSNASTDTVKEVTFVTLKSFISKTKANIIVIPSTNQSFISEAISKIYLHKQNSKDSIIVLGLSNFQEIESLDFGYLKALNAIVSSNTFVDYGSADTKKFLLKYRNEFKTDPTEYVFAGFDVAYFYLGGLQKYGNALQYKLPELKQKGIQTEFNFFQADKNSGYENRGIGIMKFDNYSYVRVK